VARLAIAKGFLAEYAKLDKNLQSSVEAAISKFAQHTHAGIHLEKLQHSRDDRIRTIRIDSMWRGVVLAPETGDTYCLIRVLPHDKANAYAASHRFSVNQVLGVLEVRDEEALQRLQPSLHAAAEPHDKRLFAGVSDADLARLGVDAHILPIVRLLSTDPHLEAMQSVLPEAQYSALYALACGMTVEEAWNEVVQLLPSETPPEKVDTSDLVSAMKRTPGEVTFVSGQDELRSVLSRPFAAWRTFLHPSQRKIAYKESYSGPAQVTGGAGTGKTVTALHRAAFLAERAAVQPAADSGHANPPILLTTFTRNLSEALDSQLRLLVENPAIRSRIEVLNVDRLAHRIVRQARGTPAIIDDQSLRRLWTDVATETSQAFSAAFLQHEWEQVILGQDLRSGQAYLACPRSGRGRPLTKAQRSEVWCAAERVREQLSAAGHSTYTQLANEATQLLRRTGQTLYRHVIVDEAQDLHPAQWRLLREAAAAGPDDLFVAADPHQRIYRNRVSLVSLGIQVRGRSRRLTLNYRTTQEILGWALLLLGTAPVTGLDGEVDTLLGYRSPMHGQLPEIRGTATRAAELKALAERIRSWLEAGIEPHAIGVAARNTHLARDARDALQIAGIPTMPLTGHSRKQAVRTGTMHGMKGLEFQAVAVIGVSAGMVPAASAVMSPSEDAIANAQDLQRERCLLFVACTRARDHLYVSYTGEPSRFLNV
jgi:hypothetical protein